MTARVDHLTIQIATYSDEVSGNWSLIFTFKAPCGLVSRFELTNPFRARFADWIALAEGRRCDLTFYGGAVASGRSSIHVGAERFEFVSDTPEGGGGTAMSVWVPRPKIAAPLRSAIVGAKAAGLRFATKSS